MPQPVVLVGALDTKGDDVRFARDTLAARGLETIVVDFGVVGDPPFAPDIAADDVARAGGYALADLRASGDKALAMQVMQQGLKKVVKELYEQGRLGGILGMGGGAGTSLACAAMRELPIGVPKVMASTLAGGDVTQYVGSKDITMMPTIVDVSGLNSISRRIYTNAAAALAGMVEQAPPSAGASRPLITASMFGNTTACIQRGQKGLEGHGYEVLVFHATGAGGRTMESLIADGFISANLDLTTTELADHVCGGVLDAGPDRLMAAARAGVPTIVAPGCVDMCNFWAPETVPDRYAGRRFYQWNPNITLMRTTPDENRQIGEWIARAANASQGPIAVLIPLKGVSQLDAPGGAFWDAAADRACYDAIRTNLRPGIPYVELDANINDPEFADKAVEMLLGMLRQNAD